MLWPSLEIYSKKNIGMEHFFIVYDFSTENVSTLSPLRVANRFQSGTLQIVFVPGRDKVCIKGLEYASTVSYRDEWWAVDG